MSLAMLPFIVTVYVTELSKSAVGLNVIVLFVGLFQLTNPDDIYHVDDPSVKLNASSTEVVFILSLKTSMIFTVTATLAPVGKAVVTVGGRVSVNSVVKLHGFGTGPAASGFPTVSLAHRTW